MNLIDLKRAGEILSSFNGRKITVIGDSMLDQWIWGKVSRISPEAPVPVVDVERLSYTPGGAANVVNNIGCLGGKVSMFTVTGDDENADKLIKALADRGADISGIIKDPSRPTTTKTRIVANSQQLCRTDTEKRDMISGDVLERMIKNLSKAVMESDLCVISDYNKGLFSYKLFTSILSYAKEAKIKVVAGPKPANIEVFKGADLMTLNEKEAREAYGRLSPKVLPVEKIGNAVRKSLGLDALLVTRGDKGMALFEKDTEPFLIPALASEVFDVSGAGDTVLSVASLALSAGASLREAIVLSNFAAAVVVKKVGTATVSQAEILDIIGKYK